MRLFKQTLRNLINHIPNLKHQDPRISSLSKVQQEYIKNALKKIASGRPHASLGANIDEKSKQCAIDVFKYLCDLGIKPEDTVVDYGCGTLRIGRLFIEYLHPSKYIGMDLDPQILAAGLELIDPITKSNKSPVLKTINPRTLKDIALRNPKLIFAKGVVQHVPPFELERFFFDISVLGRESLIVIAIKQSEETAQLSNRSWSHGRHDVLRSSSNAGLTLIKQEAYWHHFRAQVPT